MRKRMLILIYGGRGWIGRQFISECIKQEIDYVEGTARCDNTEQLTQEIEQHNPTHIVSFIGRTHGEGCTTIDYLEQPGKLDENIRDNLFSPLQIAIICKQKHIHYTYLGTGCIFQYDELHTLTEQPFNESDKPNFNGSSYSLVKGYTDRLMHQFDNTVLNLRIRMPITSTTSSRNFITKITNYKKICSIKNSMTVLDDFIPIFLDMIKNKVTGTINCVNPGTIDHNEILKMYREIIDPLFKWENFSIEEQDQILLSKRSNNWLDTTRIENMYKYPKLDNIKNSVRRCLYRMFQNEMFAD